MSLEMPKVCETCGENVHGYGHKENCPNHSSHEGDENYANPSICEGCGYPLVNHPRMGCAYVEGK